MTPSELEDAVSKATAHFIIEYKKHSDTKYDFNLRGKKNFWNVRLDFSSGYQYSARVTLRSMKMN